MSQWNKKVPKEIFGGVTRHSRWLSRSQQRNGAISILNQKNNNIFQISKDKRGWWYHHVVWTDMNDDGLLDGLTARAKLGFFGTVSSEMLWLEQPNENVRSVWKGM